MEQNQTAIQTQRFSTKEMTYIAIFSILMAVTSWISIPSTVPFTLQTMGVFITLWLLGGKRGTMAIGLFILMGAIGLPVFAGFQGGLGILLGSTGGYIIGFLASGLCYWGTTAICGQGIISRIAGLLLGLTVCYALGTGWFMMVYLRTGQDVSLSMVLAWCVIPFIIPDLIKLALGVLLGKRLEKHLTLTNKN